jgi:addiction module RelE/StbE family toxin
MPPMKMEIKYTKRFRKQYQKADKEIRNVFTQALELFLEEPVHPILRNHPLKEKFTGYRSINVTADWRAIFKQKQSDKRIIITFYLLGTHKELYG